MFLFRCCLNSGCSHHSSPEHQTVEDLDSVDKSKLHSRLLPSVPDDGKWFTDYNGCSQHAITAQPLVLDPIDEDDRDESQLPQPTKEMYRSGESGFGETSSLHLDQSVESSVLTRSHVENELSMSPSKDSLFVSSLEEQKPSDEESCSELSPEVKYIADAIYFQSSIFSGDKLFCCTQDFDNSSLSNNSASVVSESAIFHQQFHNYVPALSDSFKPSIVLYKPEDDQPEILSSLPLQGQITSALGPIHVDSEQTFNHSSILNQGMVNSNHFPAVASSSDDDDSSTGETQSISDDSHVHFVYSFTDNLPGVDKSIVWNHSFRSKVGNPSTSVTVSSPQDTSKTLEVSLGNSHHIIGLEVIDSDGIEDVMNAEDNVPDCHVKTKPLPKPLPLPSDAACIILRSNTAPITDDSTEPRIETLEVDDIDSGSACRKLSDGNEQGMHSDICEGDSCGICLLTDPDCNFLIDELSQPSNFNFEAFKSSPVNETESSLETESGMSCGESRMSFDLISRRFEVNSYIENIIRDAIILFTASSTDTVDVRPIQDHQAANDRSIQIPASFSVSDYLLEQQESILDEFENTKQDDCRFNVGDQLLSVNGLDISERSNAQVSSANDVEITSLGLAEENGGKCLKNVKSLDPFDIQSYYICRGNNQKVDNHSDETDFQQKLLESLKTNALCQDDNCLENSANQFSLSESNSYFVDEKNNCEDGCEKSELSERNAGLESQLMRQSVVSSSGSNEAKNSKPCGLIFNQLSDMQDLEDCGLVDSLLDELVEHSDNTSNSMIVVRNSLETGLCQRENLNAPPQLEWSVFPITKSSRKFSPTSELVDMFFESYVVPVNEEVSNLDTVDDISLLADADNISLALDKLELELESIENDDNTDGPNLTVEVLKSDDVTPYGSIRTELLECHPCLSLHTSPRQKKSVRFADTVGHCLESIRHIDNSPTAPTLPAGLLNVLPSLQAATDRRARWAERHPRQGVTSMAWRCETRAYLRATFTQPGTLPDFADRVRTSRVVLESCTFDDSAFAISGVVRVANIAYHKAVSIRYTLDCWATQSDVDAEYVPRSNDGTTDRYEFTVILPPRRVFGVGSRVEFAICYSAGDDFCETHWDNNLGTNYVIECCYGGDPSTSEVC